MQPAPTRPPRDHRLDAIRGVAIIGVPFSHAVRGLSAAGMLSPESPMGVFEQQIACMIHLPLFVLTTGLLIPNSVDSKGPRHYLAHREISLLWPFLIWTALQGSIQVLTSQVKNQPTSWIEVLTLWEPIGQLWYLPFLMIATVIVVAIRPWKGGARLWIGLAVGLAISMTMWGRDGTTVLTRGMSLTALLVIGSTVGRERIVSWWNRTPQPWLFLGGLTSLASGTLLSLYTPAAFPTSDLAQGPTVASVGWGMLASALLCSAVIAIVVSAASIFRHATSLLAYLGRHSMEIFLAHILITAGTRILLLRLGVVDSTIHIVAGTTLGTSIPLVLVPLSKYVPWLLTPPRALLPQPTSRPR